MLSRLVSCFPFYSSNSPYCCFFLGANRNIVETQYFGLKEDQAPLILIQDSESKKFLKEQVEADQIVAWLKDYFVSSPFLVLLG